MDVRMPIMDGFETAALIRERPQSRYTPIIFLTAGHSDDQQVFQGYATGAVDYLLMPAVPEILRPKGGVCGDGEKVRIDSPPNELWTAGKSGSRAG